MKNYKYILEAINRGIKLALDDFEDDEIQDQSSILSKKKVLNYDSELDMILYENFVDLGLPSGTLWAKYNLGVNYEKLINFENYKKTHYGFGITANDWYGKYYAWGETEANKPEYTLENYKWFKTNYTEEFARRCEYDLLQLLKMVNVTKYNIIIQRGECDGKTILDITDDAANKYNSNFKIPTLKQYTELILNCEYYWISNYNKINSLNGLLFVSKINGNSIFFPAAGFYDETSIKPDYIQLLGCYWSSSLAIDSIDNENNTFTCKAKSMWFDKNVNKIFLLDECRCYGLPIRPVLNK